MRLLRRYVTSQKASYYNQCGVSGETFGGQQFLEATAKSACAVFGIHGTGDRGLSLARKSVLGTVADEGGHCADRRNEILRRIRRPLWFLDHRSHIQFKLRLRFQAPSLDGLV